MYMGLTTTGPPSQGYLAIVPMKNEVHGWPWLCSKNTGGYTTRELEQAMYMYVLIYKPQDS